MKSLLVDSESLYHSYVLPSVISDGSAHKSTNSIIRWLDSRLNQHNADSVYLLIPNHTGAIPADGEYFYRCIDLWAAKQAAFRFATSSAQRSIDAVNALIEEMQEVEVASCDLRMAQFLKPGLSVLQPTNDHPYTHEDLASELDGITPQKIPLFLSLIGHDLSGTNTISGNETALNLVNQSDPDIGSLIKNAKTQDNYDLVAIYRSERIIRENLSKTKPKNIALRFEYLVRQHNPNAATELSTLLAKNTGLGKSLLLPNIAVDVITVIDSKLLDELKTKALEARAYGLLLEKDNTGVYAASFSFKDGEVHYLPLAARNGQEVPAEELISQFKNIVENSKGISTFSAYETTKNLLSLNIKQARIIADCTSGRYLLNTRDSISEISDLDIPGSDKLPTAEDFLSREGRGLAHNAGLEKCALYSSIRSDISWRNSKAIFKSIQSENLKEQYLSYEIPQAVQCAKMAAHGLHVDLEKIKSKSEEIDKSIKDIISKLKLVATIEKDDLSDDRNVASILTALGLKTNKSTNTNFSVSKEALLEISSAHKAIPLIIEARKLHEEKDGLKTLIKHTDPASQMLHYNVVVNRTLTSRLSTVDPNAHGFTDNMRANISPREGYVFVGFDISQMELRILAELSQEPVLIKAFKEGKDVHLQTAAEVFNVTPEDVTEDQRKAAKAINFGIIYGMSAFGLSKKLGISSEKAGDYIEAYFNRLPMVRKFKMQHLDFVRTNGFMEMITGRKIFFPDISSNDKKIASAAERSSGNAPMQGTAGEYVKRALICCNEIIESKKLDACLVLQVHDELIFEVRDNQMLNKTIAQLKHGIENAIPLTVPVKTDFFVGESMSKKARRDNNLPSNEPLTMSI